MFTQISLWRTRTSTHTYLGLINKKPRLLFFCPALLFLLSAFPPGSGLYALESIVPTKRRDRFAGDAAAAAAAKPYI